MMRTRHVYRIRLSDDEVESLREYQRMQGFDDWTMETLIGSAFDRGLLGIRLELDEYYTDPDEQEPSEN